MTSSLFAVRFLLSNSAFPGQTLPIAATSNDGLVTIKSFLPDTNACRIVGLTLDGLFHRSSSVGEILQVACGHGLGHRVTQRCRLYRAGDDLTTAGVGGHLA